jgi:hypothetical protein
MSVALIAALTQARTPSVTAQCVSPGQQSDPALARSWDTELPANLILPDVVRPLVMSMWRQSPTFRRQCSRLAERPEIVVRVALVVGIRDAWARVHVATTAGRATATVQVEFRRPDLYVELIAHELEHVLERVDGTDLRLLARQRVDGVVSMQGEYETARARSVGRTVAREVSRP